MAAAKEQYMKWVDMNRNQKIVQSFKVCIMVLSLGFIFPKVF